jgi:8-oxo-dGTP diphosphatase
MNGDENMGEKMTKINRYFWFLFILPTIMGISEETQQLKKTAWHVPIGVGVLMIKEDRVLMLKRAYKDWGFGVVAGELNKGETLRQAAVRHVEKEIGVTINEQHLNFLCFVHYKTEDNKESPLVFFFSVQDWLGEPFNKEPDKHSEIAWFNIDQLPDHLAPGEDLVFDAYKGAGSNHNPYLERGWKNSL